MKKELITHFSFLVAFFIFISIFRGWLTYAYLPFWFGGIIGTILPDLDHIIYTYFLRPHELTSQRVHRLVYEKDLKRTWDLLAATRTERGSLIFHTAYFQMIFLVFAFLVITSSGSLLGKGLVLAFVLHLLLDQFIDLVETGNLDNWFGKVIKLMDKKQRRWYLFANLLTFLIFGFLL
jgi:hypothetical protein